MLEKPGAGEPVDVGEALEEARELQLAGRLTQAAELLARLAADFSHDARVHLHLGLLFCDLGLPGPARTELARSVELDPSCEEAVRAHDDLCIFLDGWEPGGMTPGGKPGEEPTDIFHI